MARVRTVDREKIRGGGLELERTKRQLAEAMKELAAAKEELLEVARLRTALQDLEARIAALEGGIRG